MQVQTQVIAHTLAVHDIQWICLNMVVQVQLIAHTIIAKASPDTAVHWWGLSSCSAALASSVPKFRPREKIFQLWMLPLPRYVCKDMSEVCTFWPWKLAHIALISTYNDQNSRYGWGRSFERRRDSDRCEFTYLWIFCLSHLCTETDDMGGRIHTSKVVVVELDVNEETARLLMITCIHTWWYMMKHIALKWHGW